MASSQSSFGFLSSVLHHSRLVCLEDLFSFPACLDFIGAEKKNTQHPACPGRHFSLGLEPQGVRCSLPQEAVVGSGQRTL